MLLGTVMGGPVRVEAGDACAACDCELVVAWEMYHANAEGVGHIGTYKRCARCLANEHPHALTVVEDD